MMFQNAAWVIDPFKVQDRPVHFNFMKYEEIIHSDSDTILLLPLEEPYLLSVSILSKNIHSYLKRLLKFSFFQCFICGRLDFLHKLQLKLHYNRLNAEAGMRIQLSSFKPHFKEMCKNVKRMAFFGLTILGKTFIIKILCVNL